MGCAMRGSLHFDGVMRRGRGDFERARMVDIRLPDTNNGRRRRVAGRVKTAFVCSNTSMRTLAPSRVWETAVSLDCLQGLEIAVTTSQRYLKAWRP